MTSKTIGYRFSRTNNNVTRLGTLAGEDKLLDRALKSAIEAVAKSDIKKVDEVRASAEAAVARLANLNAQTAIAVGGAVDDGVAAGLVDHLRSEIIRSKVMPASLSADEAAANFDKLTTFMSRRLSAGEVTIGVGGLVVDADDVIQALGLNDEVDHVAAATWVKAFASPSEAPATLAKGREQHELLVLVYVVEAARAASAALTEKAAMEGAAAAERARDVAMGRLGFFGSIARSVASGIENAAARAATGHSAPANPFRATAQKDGPFTAAQRNA